MTGAVDDHVAALSTALYGPARVKARMLREVRDGLADAADALADGGWSGDEAARQAVREFGTVEEIAPGFQRELTLAQARRTARTVALAVPILIICWYLVSGGQRLGLAELLAVHLGGLAAIAALLAALALAATGRLSRRLPTPHGLPLMVAWTGTTAGAALAASALTLTTASILAADWPLIALTGAVTIASHTRIAASSRTCRQCARLARAQR